MICFPNAKINLGLNVISKRHDGFHDIETLLYPIELCDALEIVPITHYKHNTPGNSSLCDTTKTVSAISEDGIKPQVEVPYRFFGSGFQASDKPEENLVCKALKLMKNKKDIPPIDIHLLKKIPIGAGLGGGSSDAAFMLKLLNNTFEMGFNSDQLALLAAELGSDCPFFIYNQPAIAYGRGDKLHPIDIDLSHYNLLVVKPNIFVSTAEAYSLVTPKTPKTKISEIIKKPIKQWKNLLVNDFEKHLFKKYPEINDIKQKMYDMGADYASMSGSGSAVFAFLDKPLEPQKLKIDFPNCYVWYNECIN